MYFVRSLFVRIVTHFLVLIHVVENVKMEKAEVQKLCGEKSSRVAYERVKGISSVWPHFVKISVDEKFTNFVKCVNCPALLKWKSRDGTSGLMTHLASCEGRKKERLQTLPSMTLFTSPVASKKTISAGDKSDLADAMVMMCAKDIR